MQAGGRSTGRMMPPGSTEGGAARGGSAGRPLDEKEARRKHLSFEDDDAWLDDEETGPGVIG